MGTTTNLLMSMQNLLCDSVKKLFIAYVTLINQTSSVKHVRKRLTVTIFAVDWQVYTVRISPNILHSWHADGLFSHIGS